MSRKTMTPGIIVLGVVLLVAACGRSAPAPTVSVSDYLANCEWVAEEEIALPTWGDYRTAYAALIAEREAIEPPVVLRDFHRATLHALTLVARAVEEYPPDDPANPLALFAVGLLAFGVPRYGRRGPAGASAIAADRGRLLVRPPTYGTREAVGPRYAAECACTPLRATEELAHGPRHAGPLGPRRDQ